ncbi:MAG: hypothetical protein H6Q90_1333 [Deltaproteobacteria bacterium]|nr:hypothetical protein [Deltaproteobacteria bacterium]
MSSSGRSDPAKPLAYICAGLTVLHSQGASPALHTLQFATVPAQRIIAVSPDQAFGDQLATALSLAGAVETHRTLDSIGKAQLQAPLWVIHFDGALIDSAGSILRRLGDDSRVIAVLPRANLSSVVGLMQTSERVVGMMAAEDLDPSQLSAMAARILTGDIFGLEQLVIPGTQIHSHVVADYEDKARCIAQVADFAELLGVPRKYDAPIEQCLDEMLMNALYDAPVDEHGKSIFADVPTKTRVTLRIVQPVLVQYACDGKQFVISVRDAFGSLERARLLRVLHKCLHAKEQIDRKAGGAGVGLYMMVNSSTTVYFSVVPGAATAAVCMFDLEAPQLQLAQFGCFVEQRDLAGRLTTGPSPRMPAGVLPPVVRSRAAIRALRARIAVITAAIAAIVAIGIVAWPRIFVVVSKTTAVTFTTIPKGATIEIEGRHAGTATQGTLSVDDLEIGHDYPVVVRLDGYEPRRTVVQPHAGANELRIELQPIVPRVELDSEPTGASIEIDGKLLGGTPLTVTSLVPGREVAIVFKRAGYRAATARLQVPRAGETKRLVQPLEVSDEFVRVHFVSVPSGAQLIELGTPTTAGASRTYTPADVFVEANKVQRFMLTMPGHVPLVIEPFTPARGAGVLEKGGPLIEGASLHLEATRDGKVTVVGARHCQDVAVPVDCTLAPGTYVVEYVGPNNVKATHTVKLTDEASAFKFELAN